MSVLADIFDVLKKTDEIPARFGAFHTFSLIMTVAATIVVCRIFKNPSERTVRQLLLVISVAVIILEIYKQVIFSLEFEQDRFIFNYKWHIFPWQFCSTPMLAGLAAALIKNKSIHYMLCCYLASYGLVAGILTIATGSSLFSNIIGINIQTMVCHGSMVVIGVFLLSNGYVTADNESLKAAIPPFLAGAVIAMVLNQAAYLTGIPEGEVFNMYFISPYFPEDQPLLTPIRRLLPDPIFQIVYLTGFTVLARLALTLFGRLRRHRLLITEH